MDVCGLPALELEAALRRRDLSAAEVLEAVLDRADAALARGEGGRSCGIPVAIKDSHRLAGVTSAIGSRARADVVPSGTSAAVVRLQAAGAVIYAKTTTPEFYYARGEMS